MIIIPIEQFINFTGSYFNLKANPNFLFIGRLFNEDNFIAPFQTHENFTEIIYIQEGHGEVEVNGQSYSAVKGDILVYNQGTSHQEDFSKSSTIIEYHCAITGLDIEGMKPGCLIPDGISPLIHTADYREQVENYFNILFEECNAQKFGFVAVANSIVLALVMILLRSINDTYRIFPTLPNSSLSFKIKDYIDKNFSRNMTIDDIAEELYISPYHLSHVFKNEFGDSPINYLINQRMNEVKRLLSTTEIPIQDVAIAAGYDNLSYFSATFKKRTGFSPSKYRENRRIDS